MTPLVSPRNPAEAIAPNRLPTPPTTTTRKPSTTSEDPMSGATVLNPAIMTPATPASPEP